MLDRLALFGLTNAALATLLTAVLWLAYRRIKAPHVVRLLAIVVLLRFLAPPVLPWGLLPSRYAPGAAAVQTIPLHDGLADPIPSPPAVSLALQEGEIEAVGPSTEGRLFGSASIFGWSVRVATLGWSLGIALLAWLAFSRHRRFRRALRSAVPAPAALVGRTEALARLLGLDRVPAVLVVDEGQSPAVMAGPGEPRLVLPRALLTQLDGDELDTVLLHELAHLRRKDGLVRWLELAACTLFWWNPAVWWTRRRLRDAEEACCDEVVLRHLPQHASAYAEALVKTLALQHDRALPATVSTMTSVHRMEERLEMILHGSSSRRRPWLTTVVGVLSLGVVGVFPTFSQDDPREQLSRQDAIEARFEEQRISLGETRRLEQEAQIRDEEAEQRSRLLALEDEMLAAQLAGIRSEAERDLLNDRRDRLEYERNELDELLALEADRFENVQRLELETRRLHLEAQRLERSGELEAAEDLVQMAAALEQEALEGQIELEVRQLDLEERRIERENRERRTIRERAREPRGEREARIEREVRLRRAEIALRRADVEHRRRELEIVRGERQTRGVSAEARRALEESRARSRVERERVRRNYEGLRREYEGRHMEAEAMAQVEVLREILQRLDDDGAASRHLEELESSLEELLRRRADEAERQEGSP